MAPGLCSKMWASTLKGVPDRWHLYRVVDGRPEQARQQDRRSQVATAHANSPRHLLWWLVERSKVFIQQLLDSVVHRLTLPVRRSDAAFAATKRA